MRRAALFCPGRGSYTEASLGTLPAGDPWVRTAEDLRRSYELPALLELDGAERFRASLHLRPANVSALIYLITLLDARQARGGWRVVCVGGNSMGWYSALAVAGALSFEDGFRLVQEMALLQEEQAAEAGGGQVLYPLVDEAWHPDPGRAAAVERALATSGGAAAWSIRLGGYAVLAGTEEGVAHLLRALPPVQLGQTPYPFRLVQHGPYHTAWQAPVSARAFERLGELAFRAPDVPLVDGRGRRFTPTSADPAELRAYTLGAQVTTPYDFTAGVRVALREYAPEAVVLPGPGNTLGGICGQIVAREGYRGVRSREALGTSEGLLVSMRR